MGKDTPVNLIHLANFNSTNIGNGALVDGLERTLGEDFQRPIKWSREPWDDYTFRIKDFDQTFVGMVNQSDGLVVGGAVTFNGRDYNDRTGTRFELPFSLWSEIRKPVVFYGLSYRHWPGQTYHHIDKLKETIERILEADNMLLSVRNDGTKEWLCDIIGIDSPDIVEVPDSAVFVKPEEHTYPEILPGAKNIIVSFNDEDMSFRYNEAHSVAGKSNYSRDHVIAAMVSTIEALEERYSINIILCPHYFDDFRMMSAFIERINPRIAHQKMVATGLVRSSHTGYFYGRYTKADLAISMRVHSMSPSIGLGTPMIPFTTQDRMSDFIGRLGLADHEVNAFDVDANQKLLDRSVYTLDNGVGVRARFSAARDMMRKQAMSFHEKLVGLFAQ